ncbi:MULTISPECIES: hypothetical protein [unclassified Exiguobacterium]|uniref:hypothetical protein n=1 Tax=unclassified Exiguobacterium TaxID=2644629 RepID=UPI000E961FB4|nr:MULTISPECIES: hypothetical protein [unclassified Exiguobacterium]HBF59683.1 hypothetical protein [Exiguobacterium sp.]
MESVGIVIGIVAVCIVQFYLARRGRLFSLIIPVIIIGLGIYVYFGTGPHSSDRESVIRIGTFACLSLIISMGEVGVDSRRKQLKREKDRMEIQDL